MEPHPSRLADRQICLFPVNRLNQQAADRKKGSVCYPGELCHWMRKIRHMPEQAKQMTEGESAIKFKGGTPLKANNKHFFKQAGKCHSLSLCLFGK
ncbi:hypothetical protein [Thermoactinomyces mirandus]|uniref:Uncharacterized protein n=1 Tax=Thermoactinomyces mirandus TaxID=2756294 RepID=A0A7W1XTM6_9BACL|nr:hypothetical protein [Thermoactinomyces mirandus]MBA4603059.1 hypothetical protein [Thermoactinomyces mirandus]